MRFVILFLFSIGYKRSPKAKKGAIFLLTGGGCFSTNRASLVETSGCSLKNECGAWA
jgi:hypothetical protein